MNYLDTDEKRQRRLVHIPMGRFGEAREVAYAALYLASDESSFVTGTEFLVDGGITAAYVTPELLICKINLKFNERFCGEIVQLLICALTGMCWDDFAVVTR